MVRIELNETQKGFVGKEIVGKEVADTDNEQLISNCPTLQWNTSCLEEGFCIDPNGPGCVIRKIEAAEPGADTVEIE